MLLQQFQQLFCCAGFSIAPGNNWVLEVGREYEVTVNIFDKVNHKIIVTEVSSLV